MDGIKDIVVGVGSAIGGGGVAGALISWWRNRGKDNASAYKTKAEGETLYAEKFGGLFDKYELMLKKADETIDGLRKENDVLQQEIFSLKITIKELQMK